MFFFLFFLSFLVWDADVTIKDGRVGVKRCSGHARCDGKGYYKCSCQDRAWCHPSTWVYAAQQLRTASMLRWPSRCPIPKAAAVVYICDKAAIQMGAYLGTVHQGHLCLMLAYVGLAMVAHSFEPHCTNRVAYEMQYCSALIVVKEHAVFDYHLHQGIQQH